MSHKLADELKSFETVWEGGYFEGDPLNPLAKSSYKQLGYISVLYATYLMCIKPYVNDQTISLEIGPGRGAWTKALLPSKEVYALDALSEVHNRFYEYLGYPENVKYFHVQDFRCEMLPDNYFTYMFSFGTFCHVSFEGITEYAIHIFPKLKSSSHCFWMVADYEKYNRAVANFDKLSYLATTMPLKPRYFLMRWLFKYRMKQERPVPLKIDANDQPAPGRWYHAGIERTCAMLQKVGYQILDPDVGTCLRDPIIHFYKI